MQGILASANAANKVLTFLDISNCSIKFLTSNVSVFDKIFADSGVTKIVLNGNEFEQATDLAQIKIVAEAFHVTVEALGVK